MFANVRTFIWKFKKLIYNFELIADFKSLQYLKNCEILKVTNLDILVAEKLLVCIFLQINYYKTYSNELEYVVSNGSNYQTTLNKNCRCTNCSNCSNEHTNDSADQPSCCTFYHISNRRNSSRLKNNINSLKQKY